MALSEDSKLYSWGWNVFSQLGRQSNEDIYGDPKEILYFTKSNSKIKQICVDMWTIMVLLDNGKVIVWGNNEIVCYGEHNARFDLNGIDDNELQCITYPIEIDSLNEIEFIHMNDHGCFAIDKNYNVFSWGYNKHGELGH